MNDTQHKLEHAKDATIHGLEVARDGLDAAKQSTLQKITKAAAMIAKAVSATTGLVATLRNLDSDDGLAWLGLARRRSPVVTMAVFGAGAAAGAGLALLLTPMSGGELRSLLVERFRGADAVKQVLAVVEDATGVAAPAGNGGRSPTARPSVGASGTDGAANHG